MRSLERRKSLEPTRSVSDAFTPRFTIMEQVSGNDDAVDDSDAEKNIYFQIS